jgi:hypothetical protein
MIAVTVIIFAHTRSTAPAMIAAPFSQRGVEIDQHHDAGLGGNAGERDDLVGYGSSR